MDDFLRLAVAVLILDFVARCMHRGHRQTVREGWSSGHRMLLIDGAGNIHVGAPVSNINASIVQTRQHADKVAASARGAAIHHANQQHDAAKRHADHRKNEAVNHTNHELRHYMRKGHSYNMRTTNMNVEHCITDEGHDRKNHDRWDKAEWFNVHRHRSEAHRCIKLKFT